MVGGSRGQTASQSNGKGIIDSIPLGSKLSALLAHLSVSDICAEDGHKVILQIIEDAHEYLKDQRLEQAFDEAIFRIFRGRRERGQTMTAFLTAKKAAFAELKKQGLDLLDGRAGRHLLGHLILRQGAFTLDQRQRLKVVTNGSIDYKEIEIALQKICGDRLDDGGGSYDQQPGPRRWRSSTFWDGDGYGDEWVGEYAETYATAEGYDMDYAADDNWMGDLVCLNDDASEVQMVFPRELPMVMEEEVSTLPKSAWTKAKAKERKAKGRVLQRRLVSCLHTPVLGEVVKVDIGYLEHRRILQAARNCRGDDRPWSHRQGRERIKVKMPCLQADWPLVQTVPTAIEIYIQWKCQRSIAFDISQQYVHRLFSDATETDGRSVHAAAFCWIIFLFHEQK